MLGVFLSPLVFSFLLVLDKTILKTGSFLEPELLACCPGCSELQGCSLCGSSGGTTGARGHTWLFYLFKRELWESELRASGCGRALYQLGHLHNPSDRCPMALSHMLSLVVSPQTPLFLTCSFLLSSFPPHVPPTLPSVSHMFYYLTTPLPYSLSPPPLRASSQFPDLYSYSCPHK